MGVPFGKVTSLPIFRHPSAAEAKAQITSNIFLLNNKPN
jgi:hypothetical protein